MKNSILNKIFILAIILIFSISLSHADTLANQLIEPVQPIPAGAIFTVKVRTLFDTNVFAAPVLASNGGFETDANGTSGDSITSWNFQAKTSLCSVSNTPIVQSTTFWATANSTPSDPTTFANGVCNEGVQCLRFSMSSCNGLSGTPGRICDSSADISENDNCSSGAGQTGSFNNAVPYPILENSYNDVNYITDGTDLNFVIVANFNGWKNIYGFAWNTVTDVNVGDRITVDLNADHVGTRWRWSVDNVRVSSLSGSSEFVQSDCNMSFNGSPFEPMTWSGANEWHESIEYTAPISTGDFNYAVACNHNGNLAYTEDLLSVERKESQYLTITPIENIESFSFNSVDFIPSSESDQLIWRVDSNSIFSETPLYKIFNSRTDEKQYFVFTSSDGSDYAFDDTLTFGSDATTPIQKIWNEDTEEYTYKFEDTLAAGETKYYKLTYRMPYKHWFSIQGSSEWFNQLPAEVLDNNTLAVDFFTSTGFSKIRSVYIEPVPDVNEDFSDAFEFQFTAWSDVDETNLRVGITTLINGTDTILETVSLTTEPHRYSVTIDAADFESQIFFKTTFSLIRDIYITDYSLVQRAYFTKRMELLKVNGDTLDIFLLNNLSEKYLQEGKQFKITTEAYDRDGVIEKLILEAYFGDTVAGNIVKKQIFFPYDSDDTQEDKAETRLALDEIFNGIIDLNGNFFNTPIRTLIIKANLLDEDGDISSVQTQTVRFIQFPYFPDDLIMNFFPTEKRKGKHPKGILQIQTKEPDNLLGFDIRIYDDTNSITTPDFRELIYKDIDFACVSSDCTFQLTIDDWIFEDVNRNTITIFALISTETLETNNRLTRMDRGIWVTPIEFNIQKIHQVVERADNTYRNDEEISLVLALQDTESTNLQSKLDIYMTLDNCDGNQTGSNCIAQTLQYKPTGFLFDDQFNLNYYFFRHLFVLDNGSLLPDGNFIGFNATITDQTGARAVTTPILASKCKNKDFIAELIDSVVGGLASLVGLGDVYDLSTAYCDTPQEKIVTTTTNSDQLERLFIDDDHLTSSPTQEAFICIATDSNNILTKPFEQDLFCYVAYTVSEKPIDDFRFRVTNPNSDLREEGSTKQYVEFNIPYELIAYNDAELLRKELETNQNTTIDTLGEFIFEGFRNIIKTNYSLYNLDSLIKFQSKTGIIQNAGVDINFNQAFSPASVNGGMFYIIKGIPVQNVQEFANNTKIGDDFDNINRKSFLNYLAENNINWRTQDAELQVIVNSFANPFKLKSDDGLLIIDEVPKRVSVNKANTDQNNNIQYDFIPSVLPFTLSSTMFYNNFSENSTLTALINITIQIKDTFLNETLEVFDNLTQDFVGTIVSFLFSNIILIAILMGLLVIFSVMYFNFRDPPQGGVR